MYQFCYEKAIIPTTRTEYVPVNLPQNVDDLLQAQRVIHRCIDVINLIKYVEDAYEDYLLFKQALKKPETMSDIRLERKARSYFLEFSVFLEHWKKYMVSRDKSKQFNEFFNSKTHEAFDNSDNYALATMLRNHIAHSSILIRSKFWGEGHYDVGCNANALLQDKNFNKTKKEIIKRQPAQMISLSPIMKESLEKLKEIHLAFLNFDFGAEEKKAASKVMTAIQFLKDNGLTGRKWFIINTVKTYFTIYSPNDTPMETVPATEFYPFRWEEYEPAIQFILSCND